MAERWSKCTLTVPTLFADSFAWLLAQSLDHPIELQDASTMSKWLDGEKLVLVASFDGPAPDNLETAVEEVSSQLGMRPVSVHVESVDDNSWQEGWKAFFEPQLIGQELWIYPPWVDNPGGHYNIQINPGMAFGTGTHETTRMMLDMMLRYLKQAAPSSILDVGSGSGILSIAGAQLGHEVEGIEIDPVAVENARHNLLLNDCQHVNLTIGAIDSQTQPRPWVLVNILAKIILSIAEDINAVSQDNLFLSGFIHSQRDEVIAAFPSFEIVDEITLGQWGCVYMKRKDP
jgi:ribosomal protein L11 methyltransferase